MEKKHVCNYCRISYPCDYLKDGLDCECALYSCFNKIFCSGVCESFYDAIYNIRDTNETKEEAEERFKQEEAQNNTKSSW